MQVPTGAMWPYPRWLMRIGRMLRDMSPGATMRAFRRPKVACCGAASIVFIFSRGVNQSNSSALFPPP